jgi:hypothetical protein
MHQININDIKLEIPGHWNELTREQLLTLARIVREEMELEELKLRMLFLFTGTKVIRCPSVLVNETERFLIRNKKLKALVSAHDLAFITTPFLKFFVEKPNNQWLLGSTLTRQLLPIIKIGRQALHGPADGLSNITFREFIFTETFLNENAHDKLIAVLYRPAGKSKPGSLDYNGDIRERFNDNIIDDRVKVISRMPVHFKKAIMWYYEGCKQHIAALFPNVFTEGTGEKSTKSTFEAFMGIVDELSNNHPAEHERVLDVYLYSALQSLNQKIEKLNKHVEV